MLKTVAEGQGAVLASSMRQKVAALGAQGQGQRLALALTFAVALTMLPADAFAQGGGGGGFLGTGTNFLNSVLDVLTNTWIRIIAIIAVVGVGIGWMLGRINWGTAASVGGGIVLVFGAAAIVDSIAAGI